MRRIIQPPQFDLFKRRDRTASVLVVGGKNRQHQYTYGLDAVCDELNCNIVSIVDATTVAKCRSDVVLVGMTSPMDIYAIISAIPERPLHTRLVVGGQGVYPFLAWRHLAHRIMFGRAEIDVENIVFGSGGNYTYDYDDDPGVSSMYTIRQPRKLLKGEESVGCKGSCRFCQYSATRKNLGKDYDATMIGYKVTEDRWRDIIPKTGNQTTALDGWSEETRRMVGKPVSDEQIVDKLNYILANIDGIMRLKVFQIVGYPWEDEKSLVRDIEHFRYVLGRVKSSTGKGRIMMMVTVTPFSPEPLTAMENEPANIVTRWRDILLDDKYRCIIDNPSINAFVLPQIPGPLLLLKRVAVNRGLEVDKLLQLYKCKELEQAVGIAGNIWEKNAGDRVSGILHAE